MELTTAIHELFWIPGALLLLAAYAMCKNQAGHSARKPIDIDCD